jgi:branched-chain amino acid transport system substrate-binding protein
MRPEVVDAVESRAESEREATLAPGRPAPSAPTRGFLFADLRDYTAFVESHGAEAAAELLTRYRALVRERVSEHEGSEVRTEGDSFYVVFPTVRGAVECGLGIVEGAAAASQGDSTAIQVGVGIHAGETVETPDGYVGTPVNIASRICSLARAGEVLVSDTVRALTQTVLSVSFESRGRRHLKGVAEPIALYAVIPAGKAAARSRWRGGRRAWALAGAGAIAIVVVAAVAASTLGPKTLPPGPWRIGVTQPVTGDYAQLNIPEINAVKLAIDDQNARGGIAGSQIEMSLQDDPAGNDTTTAVNEAAALIADPSVIGLVAPRQSSHTQAQIPETNAAGLLECSGQNSLPGLTKPRFGALDLRSARPTDINFVRVETSDDIQGPAAATFAYNDLAARTALVIDDTSFPTGTVADAFESAFHALGGRTIRHSLNQPPSPDDFVSVLSPLLAATPDMPIGAVYFAGYTYSGAAQLRSSMVDDGFGSIPILSWDGMNDGSGTDVGSYVYLAGTAAAGSYSTAPSTAPVSEAFLERYRAAYGTDPDAYAGPTYACVQILFAALQAIAPSGPSPEQVREAVRRYVVDPSHRFDTVIGPVAFDPDGDSVQQFVTINRVDMALDGGRGDWVVATQRDYGPPD